MANKIGWGERNFFDGDEPQPAVASACSASECQACSGKGGRWDDESIDQWYPCPECNNIEDIQRSIKMAIDALECVFTYAKQEARVSERQAETANERKDYRAADRAASHGHAMQKVASKCRDYARQKFVHSLEESK